MAKGIAGQSHEKRLHEYWVYFMPGQSRVQNWFCKNHGHLAVLTHDLDYKINWILFDPTPSQFRFEMLPFNAKNKSFPQSLITPGKAVCCAKIVIDLNKIKKTKYKWWRSFLPKFVSCVSIVEYILGIKTHAFTPLGLMKHLKRIEKKCPHGAIEEITFIDIKEK